MQNEFGLDVEHTKKYGEMGFKISCLAAFLYSYCSDLKINMNKSCNLLIAGGYEIGGY
jgi:hypothetical protein